MYFCSLCEREVKQLHKKSHLIPEWMYKDLYDQRHKAIHIGIRDNITRKKQQGIYEKHLMCTKCEIESQKYDHYASLILTERSVSSPEYKAVVRKDFSVTKAGTNNTFTYSLWENLNFAKLQRFVYLCILRTHYAEEKKGKYLLIKKHKHNLQKIYKDNTVIDDKSYPILIFKYKDSENETDHVYIPFINKKHGHYVIDFSGAGYLFWVFVSSHKKPDYVESIRLKTDGSMNLVHVNFKESGVYRDMESKLFQLAEKYKNI